MTSALTIAGPKADGQLYVSVNGLTMGKLISDFLLNTVHLKDKADCMG